MKLFVRSWGTVHRYWHTIRHLRASQIAARIWLKLYRPSPDHAPAPGVRLATNLWRGASRKPSMIGPTRFKFLNECRDAVLASDWNNHDWPKLWLYNLHYFDDLVAEGSATRVSWHESLVERWVQENLPATGNGWEPYPTSLRIVNWVKWASSGGTLTTVAAQSLAVQTRWLRKRLEYHLLGNHLWANAKALLFSGAFFDGGEAVAWRAKGERLLQRELAAQILPDGGHFELSPMYHAIILEDVLDILQLERCYPGLISSELLQRLRDTASRMLDWLQVMTHPDGDVAFFNDAAFEIAPTLQTLIEFATTLGVGGGERVLAPIEALLDSGYIRLNAGDAVLIADVARVGPDFLPGHAHADTLSFELSIDGHRVLVNGGTSTYAPGTLRNRERGTAAHNTVVLDGENSSEVWAGFRVARRAYPGAIKHRVEQGKLWVEAEHDGYSRLPDSVVHSRRWCLEDGRLEVVDRLLGTFSSAIGYWHLHPAVTFHANENGIVLKGLSGRRVRVAVDGASLAVEPDTWSPGFGDVRTAQVMTTTMLANRCMTVFDWQ